MPYSGDSYTDTSFRPSENLPSAQCPLGNPNCLVGGSYTGGYNWASALTTVHNRSLTVTYNHAHSGDVLDRTQAGLEGRAGILDSQWPAFTGIEAGVTRDPDATLWSVFIGVNDVDITFKTANERYA